MHARSGIMIFKSIWVKIQKRALKIILPSKKYDEALITTDIMPLRDRREKLCEHFFHQNQFYLDMT